MILNIMNFLLIFVEQPKTIITDAFLQLLLLFVQ